MYYNDNSWYTGNTDRAGSTSGYDPGVGGPDTVPAPVDPYSVMLPAEEEPTGGGGGGGGGGAPAGPSPAELFQLRKAPQFQYEKFQGLGKDWTGDPGYQFRLGQGTGALERSAAARGVLRTGGTLKDLLEYGQNFASQEYGGAYDRALRAHQQNFAGAQAEFDPRFKEWQTQAGADIQKGGQEYDRYYGYHGGGGGGGQQEDIPAPPEAPVDPYA